MNAGSNHFAVLQDSAPVHESSCQTFAVSHMLGFYCGAAVIGELNVRPHTNADTEKIETFWNIEASLGTKNS